MKRIFVSLMLLICTSSLFANFFIQQNVSASSAFIQYGFDWDYEFDDFNQYSSLDYFPLNSLTLSLLYEFNSDEDKTVHLFAGGNFGIVFCGICISPEFGINAKIAELNKTNLEFCYTTDAGYVSDIMGYSYFLARNNFDLMIVPKSRKGFYGGVGLGTEIIMDLNIYLHQQISISTMNNISLHLAGGYRF